MLLLDEPTNHLDLEAILWLENWLKYDKCLLCVSHSQDFLNGVCTHIIRLSNKTLSYYTGDYDTYQKTLAADSVIQQRKYDKEQADIKHIKDFIASCGTYADKMKQANSKQKILDKMAVAGLTPSPSVDKTFTFQFPECRKLPPPVLPFRDVTFSYPGVDTSVTGDLLKGLEFGVDCDRYVLRVSQIQAHCLLPLDDYTAVIKRKYTTYITSALFAHTVHPYPIHRPYKTDTLFYLYPAASR